MLRSNFNLGLLAVAASAALLLSTGSARAGMVTITLFDGAGQQQDTFVTAQGTYTFAFSPTANYTGITGMLTTNDNAGTPSLASLSLAYQATRTSANPGVADQLRIVANDSFFAGILAPYHASHTLSGVVTNFTNGSTGATSASLSSTFMGSTSATLGPTTATGNGSLVSVFGPASASGTFSGATNLTLTADLSATSGTANDAFSLQGSLQATTPEPASLALAFTGFAIAGAGAWWRRSRAKA